MQNNRYNNNNRRTRASSSTELDNIREIIYDYNENTYYYNSNIRLMIEYMRTIHYSSNRQNQNYNQPYSYNQRSRRYNTPHTPNTTTNNTSPWTNVATNIFQTALPLFEDVIVRPTNFQIENAIETIVYDPSGQPLQYLESTYCPITMEEFIPGHNLSRIRQCGHIFSQQALRNWFSANVRCPICRYDIRETPISIFNRGGNQNNIRNNITQPQPQPQPEINEDILDQIELADNDIHTPTPLINETTNTTTTQRNNWRNITNVLRTFIQQELQNNPATAELMYTFDIPYFTNDLSGNWV